MPSEKEILMIQKATMFDFKQILEANPDKTYTVEELKHLIDTYILRIQGTRSEKSVILNL